MRIQESYTAIDSGPREEQQDVVINHWRDTAQALGVCDGHGNEGLTVAEMAATIVDMTMLRADPTLTAPECGDLVSSGLRRLHIDIGRNPRLQSSGTTAAVAIFKEDVISTPNLGDSQFVYFAQDKPPLQLSTLHTADNQSEVRRVEAQGYPVVQVGRTLRFGGAMMISRAIGDHHIPFMSAVPEIQNHQLHDPGILVGGSDGLWGTGLENYEQIETLVHEGSDDLEQLARHLAATFAQKNLDNASVVIARIA